jgi:hypothetical protein
MDCRGQRSRKKDYENAEMFLATGGIQRCPFFNGKRYLGEEKPMLLPRHAQIGFIGRSLYTQGMIWNVFARNVVLDLPK